MAPENVKGKKRKGAADASPKPKKQKKSDETAANPVEAPAMVKAPRKKSEDMWDADAPAATESTTPEKKSKKKAKAIEEATEVVEAATEKPKKASKKSKVAEETAAPAEETPKKQSKKSKTKDTAAAPAEEELTAVAESKKSKKSKSKAKEPSPEPVFDEEEDSESDEDEENDQTAALLAGFESDRDESDAEKEDEGLDGGDFQDKVPKGIMKKLKNVSQDTQKPGVVFVGRIPHGFYEPQMKSYFSQFGKVLRLRVSRNKKTGAPKHYAFVEFQSAQVAEIVAKTMDKYLMFGHILQCSVIPSEQVHPELFAGANMRFKKVPRNKMAGNELVRGAERKVWEKRVAKEEKRRSQKNKDLKELMDYEYTAPALKSVDSVPKKASALENGSAPQAIGAAESKPEQMAVAETATPKKSKKAKKSADVVADNTEVVEEPQVVEKKPKKEKKAKSEPVSETKAEEPVKEKKRKVSSADAGAKVKKTKKSKA